MKQEVLCPHCGKSYKCYRNPAPTADVVIYDCARGVVMVKRKNEPHGYALPGGFIDYGEQAEKAAIREMREETSLDVRLLGILGVYSTPDRDPREHTLSVVFVGEAVDPGALRAGDDAGEAAFYPLDALPEPIVFDHRKILADFAEVLARERQLASIEPIWTLADKPIH